LSDRKSEGEQMAMNAEDVLVEYFVKVRDAASEALEQLTPPEIKGQSPSVSEANFDLNFTEYAGQKLGAFEVAEKNGNIPEKWTHGFNILKNANATISDRYHGEGYVFSYWLFNERIYRQKLKG